MAEQPADGGKQASDGLSAMLAAAKGDRLPPVEQWHPPYCGDIGMAIRADGVWMYQNSPIGRKPMVKLFSRILRRDADDKYYLVTPVEKVDVSVADAPFLAVEMEVDGRDRDQVLSFRTNVDDVAVCGPDHPLRFVVEPGSGGLKPYVRVRGRLDALVTRAVYYDLMELVVDNGDGVAGIWSGGAFWRLA